MLHKLGHMLEKAIGKFELFLNYLAVVMLGVMALLGTADVIARYAFNHPIKGALEISALLMAGAIFLIIGYVQSQKSNITLELFINRYPPRAKWVVDLFVLLTTLFLFVLIAWQSFSLALKDVEYGRLIENIYLPVYPFEFLLTFGAVMVCLECMIQMVRTAAKRPAKSVVQ